MFNFTLLVPLIGFRNVWLNVVGLSISFLIMQVRNLDNLCYSRFYVRGSLPGRGEIGEGTVLEE